MPKESYGNYNYFRQPDNIIIPGGIDRSVQLVSVVVIFPDDFVKKVYQETKMEIHGRRRIQLKLVDLPTEPYDVTDRVNPWDRRTDMLIRLDQFELESILSDFNTDETSKAIKSTDYADTIIPIYKTVKGLSYPKLGILDRINKPKVSDDTTDNDSTHEFKNKEEPQTDSFSGKLPHTLTRTEVQVSGTKIPVSNREPLNITSKGVSLIDPTRQYEYTPNPKLPTSEEDRCKYMLETLQEDGDWRLLTLGGGKWAGDLLRASALYNIPIHGCNGIIKIVNGKMWIPKFDQINAHLGVWDPENPIGIATICKRAGQSGLDGQTLATKPGNTYPTHLTSYGAKIALTTLTKGLSGKQQELIQSILDSDNLNTDNPLTWNIIVAHLVGKFCKEGVLQNAAASLINRDQKKNEQNLSYINRLYREAQDCQASSEQFISAVESTTSSSIIFKELRKWIQEGNNSGRKLRSCTVTEIKDRIVEHLHCNTSSYLTTGGDQRGRDWLKTETKVPSNNTTKDTSSSNSKSNINSVQESSNEDRKSKKSFKDKNKDKTTDKGKSSSPSPPARKRDKNFGINNSDTERAANKLIIKPSRAGTEKDNQWATGNPPCAWCKFSGHFNKFCPEWFKSHPNVEYRTWAKELRAKAAAKAAKEAEEE